MSDAGRLVLANSRLIQPQVRGNNPVKQDFAGYVVGESGEFYSGPHRSGGQGSKTGLYHSSYLGGEPVLCAGEIKIIDGIVEAINTDSGHYQPPPESLRMAVEILATYGVNLNRLTVGGLGVPVGNAAGLLALGRAVNRQPDTDGNNAMSRYQVSSTLEANRTAQERAAAFAIFKRHIEGKIHAWHEKSRKTCVECTARSRFHSDFEAAMRVFGGSANVSSAAPALPVLQGAR